LNLLLSLPEQANRELDRPVADVTTYSLGAWYYLGGFGHLSKLYYADADTSFRTALELNPTFAMAYL